jgi:surfeit locus 1 family protein
VTASGELAHRPGHARRAVQAGAALLAFVVLIGLGTWQLHRLAWKEGLLAAIAARSTGSPAPVPPESAWGGLNPDDYEYRRVRLSGTFDHAKEALVFRPHGQGPAAGEGPGYLVLTPLRLESGASVIVDRGYVPAARRDPSTRAAGQVEGEVVVTGLMRGPESGNLFTPADDPARGQWYTRDPEAIARHFDIARAAPFTVDADDAGAPGGWPKGGQALLAIPNDHLSYALTWYGLAATLAAVFGVQAWNNRRRAAARPGNEAGRFGHGR